MGKTVLVVYAHTEKTSFNAALANVAVEALRGGGHDVIVSDLYAMNYNPVATKRDIKGPLNNPSHYNYSYETGAALVEDRLVDDIKTEQAKVKAADLIIFQFPLHWMGLPAILKGWCDRTLMQNFAFTEAEFYDNGRLKGKRAILSMTTGAPESFFTPLGPHGDINILLWPLQNGILRFVGFDVLAPNISYSPQLLSDDNRATLLQLWQKRISNIFQEKPLYFIPISKFALNDPGDPVAGTQLTDEVIKELQKDEEHGLTVGQHLGRRLPPSSMTNQTTEQRGLARDSEG